MPRKRKSDRGYCLLCPTKGEYQGLKSKSSFLSSHAPSQGHQNAYRQWIHTRRSNGSTYGESFPLASAEDFFEEANDMERSAIVNDHFDWDLWYQPIKVYRTGRPTTPPLPSPSPPPPASPSRQPSPPQPTLQQRSGNTDSTTAATASPTLSFSANVNPRPSAASSSEQHSDKHAPKRDIHDQYQPSNSEMNDDNNDNNDNDNDGDNDDDESELISLAQRYSGEPSISRALARLQIGNSVLNLPNIGHFHPAVTLAQTGARELTAPSTSRANNDDNNVDDRMDVDLEESERATLPPSGADDPQAQIDEMRQALAEQQAATAADAIHFTFAQPSLEWPPMGPVFPWESNVNAIIFTQLARNLHDQTRSKVQFALDMVKALHPEDDLPTARRALTLPVGFPAPRIATVSVGEGDEFSIILPSDMIKLLVCRPDIYKQLICFPTDSINIIDSFCDTQRARELFKGFKTTTFRNSAGVNFFVGNIVEYHFASESCLMTRYGRIRQIYQAKGDGSIMIELSRIAKSADLVPANPDLIDLDTPGAEPTYWDTGELYKIKATDLVMEPRPHGVVVLGHVDILKGTHSRFTQMEHDDYHAPHHLQQCGLPILTAFIAFWFDEAKGTTSNRHDSHETAAFQLLNVPSSLNRTPKNIGFVAAVNERSASCYDIAAAAFKDIADNLEKGIPWVVPTESGGAQRVMITGGIGCFTGDSRRCVYIALTWACALDSTARFVCSTKTPWT
ncbi:hypothetical protein BCR44DRAFT_1210692 [Catenaria anguillulae PL171]|uniref:Uncharacterized protein n=1 Tax=Catenaria anguillulae PL171 TaxID=765915 RepID=A0A1Y2HH51_9FUNG|nr:hypothetical protein BCR44DRAFT_1210692 [Catenaria anguillulae PL171]